MIIPLKNTGDLGLHNLEKPFAFNQSFAPFANNYDLTFEDEQGKYHLKVYHLRESINKTNFSISKPFCTFTWCLYDPLKYKIEALGMKGPVLTSSFLSAGSLLVRRYENKEYVTKLNVEDYKNSKLYQIPDGIQYTVFNKDGEWYMVSVDYNFLNIPYEKNTLLRGYLLKKYILPKQELLDKNYTYNFIYNGPEVAPHVVFSKKEENLWLVAITNNESRCTYFVDKSPFKTLKQIPLETVLTHPLRNATTNDISELKYIGYFLITNVRNYPVLYRIVPEQYANSYANLTFLLKNKKNLRNILQEYTYSEISTLIRSLKNHELIKPFNNALNYAYEVTKAFDEKINQLIYEKQLSSKRAKHLFLEYIRNPENGIVKELESIALRTYLFTAKNKALLLADKKENIKLGEIKNKRAYEISMDRLGKIAYLRKRILINRLEKVLNHY